MNLKTWFKEHGYTLKTPRGVGAQKSPLPVQATLPPNTEGYSACFIMVAFCYPRIAAGKEESHLSNTKNTLWLQV